MSSYATIAQADAYFLNDYNRSDTWDAISDDDKTKLLDTSTRMLNTMFNWNGVREDEDQSDPFPRTGIYCDGIELTAAESSVAIIPATCEQAWNIYAKAAGTNQSAVKVPGIESVSVGPIDVKFDLSVKVDSLPNAVIDSVGCLGSVKSEYDSTTNSWGNGGEVWR